MFLLYVLIGCIPFVLGGMMNRFMMTHPEVLPSLFLISLGMLFFWFITAYLAGHFAASEKQLICGLHLIPFIVLLLLFIQEMILGAYWRNFIGVWTQLYYLPLINLGFSLTPWSHRVFTAYLMAFILMVVAALGGCCLRRKIK